MSYQSSKKKIELTTKEPVELRKAEKRWVRPSELEAEYAQAEKETQVNCVGSHDHVAMVMTCRNCSENLLAY